MKFLLGSNFWKMNVENSDNDYMQFVFPTREDLFKGNFKSKQLKDSNNDDVNVKDVRLLLKELRKGSIRAFECVYSNKCTFDTDLRFLKLWDFLTDNRDKLFNEVNFQFKKSCYGELCNRLKMFKSDFSNTKALANCYKLDFLLTHDKPFEQWFEYQAYDEAVRLRNLDNKEDKKATFEHFEAARDKWSQVEFKGNNETPTMNKLEKLLMELCFEL